MPRAVVLLTSPYWQMARELRQRHGWDIWGFNVSPATPPIREGCSRILDIDALVRRHMATPAPPDIVARAARLEAEYGVNLADILSADRHLGIGWVTGGLYHTGALAALPYEKHLHLVAEVFDALDAYFAEARPETVCPGIVGSFETAIAYAVCERRGLPIHAPMLLGDGAHHYFQQDRFENVPHLGQAYRRLQGMAREEVAALGLAGHAEEVGRNVRANVQLYGRKGRPSHFLRAAARTTFNFAHKRARGLYAKGGVPLRAKLGYHWANFRNFRREMRRAYTPLEQLARAPFVFFPPHFEPEGALNGTEPYFTNQLYAIELLSRAVPAGMWVAVKEHPATVGNRPAWWMDAIARFPRVKLLHPYENSLEVIRRSTATATITGTAGLEAALLGKPVISLGPSYRFNFVDHVHFANDLRGLRALLQRIVAGHDAAQARRDGALLQAAVELACFRLDDATGFTQITPEHAGIVADELVAHLRGASRVQRFLASPAVAPDPAAPASSR